MLHEISSSIDLHSCLLRGALVCVTMTIPRAPRCKSTPLAMNSIYLSFPRYQVLKLQAKTFYLDVKKIKNRFERALTKFWLR